MADNLQTLEKLLTVKEAAAVLSIAPMTLYRKIERGEIPAVRIARPVRGSFPRPAIGPSAAGFTSSFSRSGATLPGPLFWPQRLVVDDGAAI